MRSLRGISGMDPTPGLAAAGVAKAYVAAVETIPRHGDNPSLSLQARDLPHELAPKTELIIGIQFGERLERRVSGAGDHCVDVADLFEHGSDGARIFEI